jgi:hypothetical protein
MKSNLWMVSMALLSATLILGCQDVGSGPVGPEGLEPQLAKDKVCPGHPSCKTLGDGGNLTATLDLGYGMTSLKSGTTSGELESIAVTGMDDDNTLRFNTNDFEVDIKMNFPVYTAGQCTVTIGTNGVTAPDVTMEGHVETYLRNQLQELVSKESLGSIHLSINKTDMTDTGGNLINVSYRSTLPDGQSISIQIRYGAFGVEGPTVFPLGGNRFEFTGPIMVSAGGVGGRNGKRGRRLIACGGTGDNLTTVTVNPT